MKRVKKSRIVRQWYVWIISEWRHVGFLSSTEKRGYDSSKKIDTILRNVLHGSGLCWVNKYDPIFIKLNGDDKFLNYFLCNKSVQ